MTADQLVPLLVGPVAGLAFSLTVNYLQAKGLLINPSKVVRREDYDALKAEQAADRVLLLAIADAIAPEEKQEPTALRPPRRRR